MEKTSIKIQIIFVVIAFVFLQAVLPYIDIKNNKSGLALIGADFLDQVPIVCEGLNKKGNVDDKRQIPFELNKGQADPAVKYLIKNGCYKVFLGADHFGFLLGNQLESNFSDMPRVTFASSSPDVQITGENLQSAKANNYVGRDQNKWIRDIPLYMKVKYQNIYPSIDLAYYGDYKNVEYDLVVSPGGNPADIILGFTNVNKVSVDGAGDLVMDTLISGQIKMKKPYAYQEINGVKTEISANYVIGDDSKVRFEVGQYNKKLPLIIDPALVYSGYLPGSGSIVQNGMTIDSAGNVYIVGFNGDINILKINSFGELAFSVTVGGSGDDRGFSIKTDTLGNIYSVGVTNSTDFPLVDAYQPTFGGIEDGFIIKVASTGSSLLYSTYLGGLDGDTARGLDIDSAGNVYVVGTTLSTNFPLANAYQSTLKGPSDAFVSKLSLTRPTGLLFSTYLGGSDAESGRAIKADTSNNVYVAGMTSSTNFPASTPFQSSLGGGNDGFVSKLNINTSLLAYSTYIGGAGNEIVNSIATDTLGNAYLTGSTESSNYPTLNPLQASFGGIEDAFVTKLAATGSSLVFSTFLGGSLREVGNNITIDSLGNSYVTGFTNSDNFTVSGALQGSLASNFSDAFISKINSTGSAFFYSTYLGGTGNDRGIAVFADDVGNLYAAGATDSSNFPKVSSIVDSGTFFLAKIDPSTIAQSSTIEVADGSSGTASVLPVDGYPGLTVTFTNNIGLVKNVDTKPTTLASINNLLLAQITPDTIGPLITNLSISPTTGNPGQIIILSITAEDPSDLDFTRYVIHRPNGTFLNPVCNFGGLSQGVCTISQPVDDGSIGQYAIESIEIFDFVGNKAVYYSDGTVTNGPQATHSLSIPTIIISAATPTPTPTPAPKPPVRVFIARYSSNPGTQSVIDIGGGFVDIKIDSADSFDSGDVRLYYPNTITPLTEGTLKLQYFDGNNWNDLKGRGGANPDKNTTDNLDGTRSGGRFNVNLDNTSIPKVTDFKGTAIALAGGGTPSTPTPTPTPTPEPKTIEGLKDKVENISGIDKGKKSQLLKKLDQAQKASQKVNDDDDDDDDKNGKKNNKNKNKKVIKHLEQFIKDVEKLVGKKNLSTEIGDELILYAKDLIGTL